MHRHHPLHRHLPRLTLEPLPDTRIYISLRFVFLRILLHLIDFPHVTNSSTGSTEHGTRNTEQTLVSRHILRDPAMRTAHYKWIELVFFSPHTMPSWFFCTPTTHNLIAPLCTTFIDNDDYNVDTRLYSNNGRVSPYTENPTSTRQKWFETHISSIYING